MAPGDDKTPTQFLSQRFLQEILENVAHPVFVKDRDFRMVFVNRAHCEMTGFPREAFLGKTDYDLFPREQADFFRKKDIEMFESGATVDIAEEPITDAYGRTHVLATTKVPLRDSAGAVTHLIGIIHDITPLKEVEEDLRHANTELGAAMRKLSDNNESLRELDRLKSEFLANVSHEFRTPLTLNLSPLEEMLAEPRTEADRRRLLIMHRSTLRLLNLVNNLLSFATLESGRAEPTFIPIDVPSFTRQIAAVFESAFSRKGLTYRFEDRTVGPLFAYLDAEIWERVVVNLLQNALKYTDRGGATLSIESCPGGFELSVQDTGVGIPEEELPQIFERFHRVRRRASPSARGGGTGRPRQDGTGIGLALVSEAAHLHGGTVTAESRPGQGTRFVVRIPIGKAHLPAEWVQDDPHEPAVVVRDPSGGHASFPESIFASAGIPTPSDVPALIDPAAPARAPSETPTIDPDAPTILVVDDNPDMRGYLSELLSSLGRVVQAKDGEAGLVAARQHRPRLVVTDVMLGGGMDGFDLCQQAKADPLLTDIPVILLTARADISELARGLSGGAYDYVLKPFNPTELKARARLQLTLCQARAELRQHADDLERRLDEKVGELRRQHADLETILKSLGEGVLVFDACGSLSLCNDAANALTGVSSCPRLSADAWADWVSLRLPDGKPVPPAELPVRRALLGESVREVELRIRNAETGRDAFVIMSAAPLPGSGRAGAVCTLHDVSRLKEAERLKDEFLSVASHELRTPLGSLQLAVGMMRLLLRDSPAAPMMLPQLDRQQRQIGRLNRLIGDILDMSRLQQDKLSVQVRPVEIATALRDAVDRARATVGIHHRIVLDTSALPPGATRVLADPDRLDQVLGNLLANACKYAPPESTVAVTVSCRLEDGTRLAEIRVSDAGPGIPEELHERIFERFFQIEAAAGRAFGGLGLGLYISRALMLAQGGRMWVDSQVGQGSTFCLTLPLSPEENDVADAG